jgi:hypothetical protein
MQENIEKNIELVTRLNRTLLNAEKVFHNLKHEIEEKYEFFEQNIKEVNGLIEKGSYSAANNSLDWLDSFVNSLRKNVY